MPDQLSKGLLKWTTEGTEVPPAPAKTPEPPQREAPQPVLFGTNHPTGVLALLAVMCLGLFVYEQDKATEGVALSALGQAQALDRFYSLEKQWPTSAQQLRSAGIAVQDRVVVPWLAHLSWPKLATDAWGAPSPQALVSSGWTYAENGAQVAQLTTGGSMDACERVLEAYEPKRAANHAHSKLALRCEAFANETRLVLSVPGVPLTLSGGGSQPKLSAVPQRSPAVPLTAPATVAGTLATLPVEEDYRERKYRF